MPGYHKRCLQQPDYLDAVMGIQKSAGYIELTQMQVIRTVTQRIAEGGQDILDIDHKRGEIMGKMIAGGDWNYGQGKTGKGRGKFGGFMGEFQANKDACCKTHGQQDYGCQQANKIRPDDL